MSSWLVNLLEGEYQSMVIDVAVAVTMNGVTASPPRPEYDKTLFERRD